MQESKFVPAEVPSNPVESGANVGEVPTESPEVRLPTEKAYTNPEQTSVTNRPQTESADNKSSTFQENKIENANAPASPVETASTPSVDGNLETAIAAQAQLEAGLNANSGMSNETPVELGEK